MNISIIALLTMFVFASCTYAPITHSNRSYSRSGLPPGQAKKVYGTKSAKPFAPGQHKKYKH